MKKWMMALTLLTMSSQAFALRINTVVPDEGYKVCRLDSPFPISFEDKTSVHKYQAKGIITTISVKRSVNMFGIMEETEHVTESVVIADDQGNERVIHPDYLTISEKVQLKFSDCK